ncbi:MAG TPA: hypothetical protein DIT32_02145 [Peptococcaceae bacterium]|nr:hypothetical protein [Peptococcaceae bacterium]
MGVSKELYMVEQQNQYAVKKGYLAFAYLICLFVLLLLFRDVGGYPVSKYFFIGIASLIYLFGEQTHIVAFLAFITPLGLGVSYNYMQMIALLFIFFKSERIEIGKAILFPFLIVFIELTHSFFSPIDSLGEFIRSVMMIILVAFLFLDKSKVYDYRFILKMYLLGFVVLAFFSLYNISQLGSVDKFLEMGTTLGKNILAGREGTRIFAGNNDMGLFAAMAVAVSLLLILTNQGNKILLSLIVILGFALGLMATSRSFVFSAMFCLMLSILFSAKNPKNLMRSLAIAAVLSLVIILLVNTILSGAYATFNKKMQMADISNGRFSVFAFYMKAFLSEPKIFLTGMGLQNYVIKANAPESVHNAVQEVLIAWGSIGFLLVTGFFAALYQNAVRLVPKKRRALIFLMPALVYLFRAQLARIFSVGTEALPLLIVYCSIALNSQIAGWEGKEDGS